MPKPFYYRPFEDHKCYFSDCRIFWWGGFAFNFTLKSLYQLTPTKNSDFQKFDDTLRMTIDSKPGQRKELLEYLETELKAGKLFYGTHISDSALMTCMVFDRKERHLHFVDGASGGYALAAKQLKGQIASKR
ncbi:MAG: DUF3095 family protein [Nitrospinaceae bacterium]|jgi:hypothetical protein|nr:DUF3095 family protein [Nitrospinaceae bacterium]